MSRSKFRPRLHVKQMIRTDWPDWRKKPVPFPSILREEGIVAHPGLFVLGAGPPEPVEEPWDFSWAEHRRREELAFLDQLVEADEERYNESWWMSFLNDPPSEQDWLEEENFGFTG